MRILRHIVVIEGVAAHSVVMLGDRQESHEAEREVESRVTGELVGIV